MKWNIEFVRYFDQYINHRYFKNIVLYGAIFLQYGPKLVFTTHIVLVQVDISLYRSIRRDIRDFLHGLHQRHMLSLLRRRGDDRSSRCPMPTHVLSVDALP